MANENIVPTRGNLQTDLSGGTPNIGGFQSIQGSQFSAPPQVEWTSPSKSNELLQVSEALSDLNPQLKGFGTTFTRYEALQDDLAKKLAETDSQILSIDNARELNRKGVNELVANGTLKAEQLPAYYTNLQRFTAQRVAKNDFTSFVLNEKDSNTGNFKYADRLNDWSSTEDPQVVLQEATRDWISKNPSSSQIYTDSAYAEANKISEKIAESAVQNRWSARKNQMEEVLIQEGQDILTDAELNNEDPQPKMQEWLNKTKYVPGAFKKWAEGSLQPFALRMAMDNPDNARLLLSKYENITTGTGARLGAGANFGTFQGLYAQIDRIERSEENKNIVSREAKLNGINDHINNVLTRYVDQAGGNVSALLDNNVKQNILKEVIGKDVIIPLEGKEAFRLDENNALTGTARVLLEKRIEDTLKTGNRENLQLISDFKIALKNDPERAEQMYQAITDIQGWGFGENSQAKGFTALEEMRSGIGMLKSKPIQGAVGKVSAYLTQMAIVGKTDTIGMTAIEQVANPATLSQEILDVMRPEIEKAKKENPKLTTAEIINDKIGDVAVKVQEQALKRVNETKFKLENNLEKTQQQIEQSKNAPEVPLQKFFDMGDGYQGRSLPKVSTLESKFNFMVKTGLKMKDAGISMDSPGLTESDRRAIATHRDYKNNIFKSADTILPLLAKDIITGSFPQFEGSDTYHIKYGNADLERKQDEYWRLKTIRGFTADEIASGRTADGMPIPAYSPNSPNPIGERVRNYATHFESTQELNKMIMEYQSGNKNNNLGRIFKAYNLTTDADQDSYVQQQVYLLKVMR